MFTKQIFNNKKLILLMSIILIFGISINANTYPEKDINIEEKADIILQDANKDIMNSFTNKSLINSTTNTATNVFIEIDDFKIIEFGDIMNLDKGIAMEFSELENSPIGSVLPIFLISKDSTKLAVLYKESDGTNVARYSENINGKWIRTEEKVKGSPILDIDTIDI